MRWQAKGVRRPSGGRVKYARKKRLAELGRDVLLIGIGKERKKIVRMRGGGRKVSLLSAKHVNITNPRTGKTAKGEIESVLQNLANPHWVRRNIITKGAIIQTNLGKARVTSRPGQDGVVNAVLIEEEEKGKS
jgi:small subunit ribosomal protein S8e